MWNDIHSCRGTYYEGTLIMFIYVSPTARRAQHLGTTTSNNNMLLVCRLIRIS